MPVQLSLKAKFGRLFQGLANVGRAMPRLANSTMEDVLEDARDEASGYWKGGGSYGVPLRSGQRYRRTGRYGSGTRLVNNARNSFSITQSAPHSQWVGGGAYGNKQVWFHAGRWPLLVDAVRKAVARLSKALPEKMREVFRQEGIGL